MKKNNNNQQPKARTAVRSKSKVASAVGPTRSEQPKARSYSIKADLNSDSWTANLKWGRRRELSECPAQVVTQREVITDVFGSSSYSLAEWRLQPGSSDTFPWMADIALKYQKYDIVKLVAHFNPTVSGFAPDGQQGRVTLCCDYDASNPAPTAMNQAMDMKPSISGMASTPLSLTLNPVLLNQGGKYICGNRVPAGNDPKTFDSGYLYFVVDGTTSAAKIGELILEYTVALYNPLLQLASTVPRNAIRSSAYRNTSQNFGASTVAVNVTGLTVGAGNPLGLTLDGDFIVFPPGYYDVTISFRFFCASANAQNFDIYTVSGGGAASTERFVLGMSSGTLTSVYDQLNLFWHATATEDRFKILISSQYGGTIPVLQGILVSCLAL